MRVYKLMTFLNIAVRNQIIGCFRVFPLSYQCGRGLVSVTSSRTSPIKSDHWITYNNKAMIRVMIIDHKLCSFVLFQNDFTCCFKNLDKIITHFLHSTFTHMRHIALWLPEFESNGSYFRSEYQSNKEYMPFLPVLIKLKSRENNNLVFIVSHVT